MKKLFLVSFVLVLMLTACASSRQAQFGPPQVSFDSAADYGKSAESPQLAEAGVAPEAAPAPASSTSIERMVIRNAFMKVSVADPAQSMQAVTALAKQLGGYVVSSDVSNHSNYAGSSYTTSQINIRVPSEKLDEAMAQIRALAADSKNGVINESISGKDVTAEYVDSESRLNNLKAAEKELQRLLSEAKDLEYTVEIFRELTNIRSQIEVLQGQMKYMKEASQLSSIEVYFVAEASLQPIEIGGWKPEGVAREALQALIDAAQNLASFLIWFAIAWLPFIIPLALIVYFLVKAIGKARGKRRARRDAAHRFYQPIQNVSQESAQQDPPAEKN